MSDRDDPARDDRKSPVRLPGLVVWEEESTGVEKVLDRIRRLLGGGAAEPGEDAGEASGGSARARAPIEPMPIPGGERTAGRSVAYGGSEDPPTPEREDEAATDPPIEGNPPARDGPVEEAIEVEERGKASAAPPRPDRERLQRTTLQMLPGRLEPVNTAIVRQELRFLRVPGSEQEVTVGSAAADPPGHVTIDHASVQPFHARMRFEEGIWTLESLAEVDPVRLNREPIEPGTGAHPLTDGDTVRFGRAEFVFRIA